MSPGARELVVRFVKLWLLLGCLRSCCSVCSQNNMTNRTSPPTKPPPPTYASMSRSMGCRKTPCFCLYETKKTWIDAFKHCQEKNSSLVQLKSEQVQDRVSELLNTRSGSLKNDPVWIGLERSIFGCGPWFWISGEEAKGDREWKNSRRENPQKNFCGAISRVSNSEYKWKDCNCWTEMAFICESPNKGCCH